MSVKRKRTDASSDESNADDISYLRQNILSVCRLGNEKVHGRPSFHELKARIRRAYHAEEATVLLAYVSQREGDKAAFWAELEACEGKREVSPPLDADMHTYVRLLARAEAQKHVATRMLLREKKKSQRVGSHRRVHLFDANGSMEKALEMIEALPQGSRGTHAPHTGFLKLGRKAGGSEASGERQLFFGLLLEEYALELLEQDMSGLEGRSGATASPLVDASAAAAASVSERLGARMLEAIGVGVAGPREEGSSAGTGAGAGGDEAGSSSSEYRSSQDAVEEACVEHGDEEALTAAPEDGVEEGHGEGEGGVEGGDEEGGDGAEGGGGGEADQGGD